MNMYLISPPGETLRLSLDDLPEWARYQIITVDDMAVCVGPPDSVVEGDTSILLNGKPISRLGDGTVQGGTIVEGSDRIFINGVPAAFLGGFHVCPQITGVVPHVGGPVISSRATASNKNHLPQLQEDVSSGSTVLDVETEEIEVDDAVIIGGDGELSEMARVIDKGSLILDRPLVNSYPAGTLVTKVPDEYSDTVTSPSTQYDPTESITMEDSGPIADFFLPGFPTWSIMLGMILLYKYLSPSRYPAY